MDHGARLIRLQGARIRPGTGAPDHNAEEQHQHHRDHLGQPNRG